MLHMVVMNHTPDNCPAAHPDMQEPCTKALLALNEGSAERGITVLGFWGSPVEHAFWAVADAPSAHVLADLIADLAIFHWSRVEVHPVVDIQDHPLVKNR